MAQLKCKDSPDAAQLSVEERGGWGDRLRLGVGRSFLLSQRSRRVRFSSRG